MVDTLIELEQIRGRIVPFSDVDVCAWYVAARRMPQLEKLEPEALCRQVRIGVAG